MTNQFKCLDVRLHQMVKLIRWLLIAVFAFGWILSVGGRGLSRSYYLSHGFPLWSYVLTWAIMFVMVVIVIQLYYTRFFKQMVIDDEMIKVGSGRTRKCYPKSEIKDIWVTKDYDHSMSDCYELSFMSANRNVKLYLILEDEQLLNELELALVGYHRKVFKN